ncbi:MAG: AraC family transcriptional regulator [Octadecabacter sp.]
MNFEDFKDRLLAALPDDHPDGQPFKLAQVGLFALRHSFTSQSEAVFHQPMLTLVLQGAQDIHVRDTTVTLDVGDTLLISQDVPVISSVTQASLSKPYIARLFAVDVAILHALQSRMPDLHNRKPADGSIGDTHQSPELIDALGRYLRFDPGSVDYRILGQSARAEIHLKLLLADNIDGLEAILDRGRRADRIGKAISLIRSGYTKPISVDDLAAAAGMGTSSFYAHFQDVTGSTPVNYIKDMRLHKARSLITQNSQSVSSAAFSVGYSSRSQFSREYKRKFGVSPSLDIR